MKTSAFSYLWQGADLRRLTKMLLRSVIGLASSLLGNAVIFLIIAFSVDPAEFGVFAKSYASVSLLVLAVDFGYQQRILHELEDYRDKFGGLPTRIFYLKLILAIIATMALVPLTLSLDAAPSIVASVAIGLLSLSFGHVGGAVLRAMGEHGRDSAHLLISSVTGCLYAAAIAVLEYKSVALFSLAFPIIGLLYFGLSAMAAATRIKWIKEGFSVGAIKSEFRDGISFASDMIVVRSYGLADVLILAIFASPATIGIYQIGQKFMQMILPAAQVLTNVVLPILSRRFRATGAATGVLTTLLIVLGFAAAAAAGIFLVVSNLIVTYGLDRAYDPVRALLPIFAITVAIRLWAVAPSLWLVAAGNQTVRLAANFLSLLAYIGLLFWLTPSYGAFGAALATAIAGGILFILYSVGTRYARRSPLPKSVQQPRVAPVEPAQKDEI